MVAAARRKSVQDIYIVAERRDKHFSLVNPVLQPVSRLISERQLNKDLELAGSLHEASRIMFTKHREMVRVRISKEIFGPSAMLRRYVERARIHSGAEQPCEALHHA